MEIFMVQLFRLMREELGFENYEKTFRAKINFLRIKFPILAISRNPARLENYLIILKEISNELTEYKQIPTSEPILSRS